MKKTNLRNNATKVKRGKNKQDDTEPVHCNIQKLNQDIQEANPDELIKIKQHNLYRSRILYFTEARFKLISKEKRPDYTCLTKTDYDFLVDGYIEERKRQLNNNNNPDNNSQVDC